MAGNRYSFGFFSCDLDFVPLLPYFEGVDKSDTTKRIDAYLFCLPTEKSASEIWSNEQQKSKMILTR